MAGEETVPKGLNEPWQRLQWIRQYRGYKGHGGKKRAAVAMRMPPPTYYGHDNGTTPIPRDQAIRYANFYRINLTWLLTGKGSPFGTSPIQELFDQIDASRQAEAWDFLEFLRNKSRGHET